MKKFFSLLFVITACLVLVNCTSKPHFASTQCKKVDAHPKVSTKMINEFARDDITLIPKGQLLRVIIPSDTFFRTDLPAIKDSKKPALQKLAALLKQYPACSVKIMGYTDNIGDARQLKILSLNRARSIQTYLWTQGLDAEHLYAIGYGGNNPVSDFNNAIVNAVNRRVEIVVHANCTVCY